MSDTIDFFKVLGLMMLMVSFAFGGAYWIRYFFKKIAPDFRYWLKYKVLRIKYKQVDVEMLMEEMDNNVKIENLEKSLLLSGKATPKKAKELLYVYKEMKGGGNK